jgi:uncharacterized protein YbjT (DUF2867 family)
MSNILVTGATGNVGGALIPLLREAPFTVFAGSTRGQRVAGVEGRQVDFLDPKTLPAAFADIDAALIVTPAHPQMVAMTANAVAAAKACGVKHLVRVSGAGADPASPVAIAQVQGQCDERVIESGIPYTLLRPKSFMQNFATFMRDMIRTGTVYSSQGDGRVPFIDARDVASVAATVLKEPAAHAGRAYALTGPEALTNAEAMRIIGEAIGKRIGVVSISEDAAVTAMRQMGMPEEVVEMMSSLNRIVAAGYVAELTDTVRAVTGCAPRTLAAFAQEHAAAWR